VDLLVRQLGPSPDFLDRLPRLALEEAVALLSFGA